MHSQTCCVPGWLPKAASGKPECVSNRTIRRPPIVLQGLSGWTCLVCRTKRPLSISEGLSFMAHDCVCQLDSTVHVAWQHLQSFGRPSHVILCTLTHALRLTRVCRYVLAVDGATAAYRFAFLMQTNSVVLKQVCWLAREWWCGATAGSSLTLPPRTPGLSQFEHDFCGHLTCR